MRIGIDGNEANIENRVGVNQYAAELLIALEKLPGAQQHDWIIYLHGEPQKHLPKTRPGWQYKILPHSKMWVLTVLTPHLILSRDKPDIFFTPSHYAPLFCPIPLVMSIMDLGYLKHPEQLKKYDLYQLTYWGQISLRGAKRIIAISQSVKEEIKENYPWAEKKTDVTHLGYDPRIFNEKISKESVNKIRKKYSIDGEYILFLGTLKPSKNISGLIKAFSQVRKECDLKLVIAGRRGWLYEKMYGEVESLHLTKDVIFTDFIPEEDKPALISGAKVFASPSFWEGFGIPVVEAMACGVPVVVSNAGSLPEVVGKVGTIVDAASPESIAQGIERVVSLSRAKYNVLSGECVRAAKKFSWTKTAQLTLEILEKAYANR